MKQFNVYVVLEVEAESEAAAQRETEAELKGLGGNVYDVTITRVAEQTK